MSSAIEPFNPENIPQAMQLSEMLSKSALIPTALRNKPADVFVVLAKGRELRLSPMQSLGEIHVIEGRPVGSAALKTGLCLREHSVCEYFRLVESTAQRATYETKRAGSEPVRLTWTIEQAQKAGLLGKQNWQRHPDAMLRARCSSALATAAYPDLVQGLITEDEADEVLERVEKDATPSRSAAVKAAAMAATKPSLPEETTVDAPAPLSEQMAATAPKATPPKPSRIIEVKEGETEEQAIARANPKPTPPTPRADGNGVAKKRIRAMLEAHGLRGEPAERLVMAATGKRSGFSEDDVGRVESALAAESQEPPPPGDNDAPAEPF